MQHRDTYCGVRHDNTHSTNQRALSLSLSPNITFPHIFSVQFRTHYCDPQQPLPTFRLFNSLSNLKDTSAKWSPIYSSPPLSCHCTLAMDGTVKIHINIKQRYSNKTLCLQLRSLANSLQLSIYSTVLFCS